MHATFDELLNLRNESADSPLAAHVRACTECREQLAQLQARTEALRRLPAKGAAPDRWDAIQRALHAPPAVNRIEQRPKHSREERQLRPGWLLPAASAVAVVLVVVITLQQRDGTDEPVQVAEESGPAVIEGTPSDTTRAETTPVAQAGNAARLIQESQRLESLLAAAYSEEPRLARASTELTVADLEDRILWVDYRLNLAAERGLDPYQSQRLWRERVDLLNSLVAVRYAQARTTAF